MLRTGRQEVSCFKEVLVSLHQREEDAQKRTYAELPDPANR